MVGTLTSDVLFTAVFTTLSIAVAVKFRYPFLEGLAVVPCKSRVSPYPQNPTPPVQAVAVLADQVLQHSLVLQFYKSHVRWCRDGLERAGSLARASPSLSSERPSTFRATKVRDACTGYYLRLTIGRVGILRTS